MAKVKVTKGEIRNDQVSVQSVQDSPQDSVAMPSRYVAKVHTGVSVEIEEGFCLRFSVVPELAEKGIVLTGPVRVVGNSDLVFSVLNGGREIVTIGANIVLVDCWVEPVHEVDWE